MSKTNIFFSRFEGTRGEKNPNISHLREGIAAVVIEGSGRAADIIAYAYKNATKTSKS